MTNLHTRRRIALGGVAAAALGLAACGTTHKTATAPPATGGLTVATASLPGLGSVLVNQGDGRTLYILSNEAGGQIHCTDANGCTKVWPDTGLHGGATSATAGPGVRASELGTVRSDGEIYPTYGGYPLYEYVGDSASGQSHGEGINSFGGTWTAISPAGQPVSAAATSSGGGY